MLQRDYQSDGMVWFCITRLRVCIAVFVTVGSEADDRLSFVGGYFVYICSKEFGTNFYDRHGNFAILQLL